MELAPPLSEICRSSRPWGGASRRESQPVQIPPEPREPRSELVNPYVRRHLKKDGPGFIAVPFDLNAGGRASPPPPTFEPKEPACKERNGKSGPPDTLVPWAGGLHPGTGSGGNGPALGECPCLVSHWKREYLSLIVIFPRRESHHQMMESSPPWDGGRPFLVRASSGENIPSGGTGWPLLAREMWRKEGLPTTGFPGLGGRNVSRRPELRAGGASPAPTAVHPSCW